MNTLTLVIKKITAETNYRKEYDLNDKPSVVIQNESASNPYKKAC